jgi:hypothetical protein
MESWKRIVLWFIVAALVFSFAVCQKKTEKAKTSGAPRTTEISPVPEETKPAKEPEEKPAEPAAAREEKPEEACGC